MSAEKPPANAIRPATLKERLLLRKFSKRLGLHPDASLARVLAEVRRLRHQRESTIQAGVAGGQGASAHELDGLLRRLSGMLPLAASVTDLSEPGDVPLPPPLDAARKARDAASTRPPLAKGPLALGGEESPSGLG